MASKFLKSLAIGHWTFSNLVALATELFQSWSPRSASFFPYPSENWHRAIENTRNRVCIASLACRTRLRQRLGVATAVKESYTQWTKRCLSENERMTDKWVNRPSLDFFHPVNGWKSSFHEHHSSYSCKNQVVNERLFRFASVGLCVWSRQNQSIRWQGDVTGSTVTVHSTWSSRTRGEWETEGGRERW